MSWRYQGPAGSAARWPTSAVTSPTSPSSCAGRCRSVSGGGSDRDHRSVPCRSAHVMRPRSRRGQRHLRAGDQRRLRHLHRRFANGAGSLEVSRVAAGHANRLIFEVFCENGAAQFDQRRPSEVGLYLHGDAAAPTATARCSSVPQHPYSPAAWRWTSRGSGFGQNDAFVYQARAFLEEVAGHRRGRLAAPLRHLRRRRAQHGAAGRRRRSRPPPAARRSLSAETAAGKLDRLMKLGVYNAILHDRPLPRGAARSSPTWA